MMLTPLNALRLFEPRSLREALAMLRDERNLAPLAGGTDLYVTLNAGTEPARRFLDLWRLDRLRRIEVRKDRLVIGALATYSQLIRDARVRARLPMLVAASREIGGVQVQNRGTLGGNVGNGSPEGDTLPVLAAVDAVVVLESANAERRVPFGDFYTGYRKSVRNVDELITAIEIPPVRGRQWFRKVGTRAAQAISKVVAAGTADGASIRFALGAVAPTVVRARHVEEIATAEATVSALALHQALARDISPIDDARSTSSYRLRVAANLLAQFLAAR